MSKVRRASSSLIAAILILAGASTAFCSNVVGIVQDQDHNFVNGAYVIVTDSTGKKAGEGRTDIYGRYCIPAVTPGKYTFTFDPASTGLQGGSAVAQVDIEGLTVDWFTAKTTNALASSNLGVASAATATCGGYWWPAAAAGVGLAGIGGIIGGVLGGESGGGTSATSSK